jgi:hypothetical protein
MAVGLRLWGRIRLVEGFNPKEYYEERSFVPVLADVLVIFVGLC